MDKINDLIKKRLLRKIKPDKEKAESSLRIAEAKIEKSKELFNHKFFDESLVNAYTSIFHACRAVLYSDGIQEKSHYATYIYIKEKYEKEFSKNLVNSFYNYHLNRHNILYGIDEIEESEEDSKDAIETAEEFLNKTKEILNLKWHHTI